MLLKRLIKLAIFLFFVAVGFIIFIGSFWLNTYNTKEWANLLAEKDASGLIVQIIPNINQWFKGTVEQQQKLFQTLVHFFIPVGFGLLFGIAVAIIADLFYHLIKYLIKRSFKKKLDV
ncbi:MPN385 family protein [Mycoplasmoides pneumoniae]|uniref:MPN385 family protein n=1 Tax=Mycoplasmoides pneumoniae TaxID=2104 RepID=UPI0006A739FA|nr:hypothetical protein [Mycoplasmoides pneumoniae]ALA34492.1 hypothetical protein F537_02190 [Mycoplasmoides pneumoniae 85084]ALA35192.1 hypothetical protein F535_02205 [Mycoplasmoides pneumoniae 85138]